MGIYRYMFLLLLFETFSSYGYKKPRKVPHPFPQFEEYQSQHLPSDVQVTAFLNIGEEKVFDYHTNISGLHLSFIIATCGQSIIWKLIHKNFSGADKFLKKYNSASDVDPFDVISEPGTYILSLEGLYASGFVHIYVSTEINGPEALKTNRRRSLILRPQRNNKIGIKWEQSLVDPQSTEYCLIISSAKRYGTLCGAISDRYGSVKQGTNYRRPVAASQTIISWRDDRDKFDSDPVIYCTGKKTQYLFTKARKGKRYYFDLFAINGQTNFTYKLTSNETLYSNDRRTIPLKDGKLKFVQLRETNGEALLKYKVGRKTQNSLDIYIIPCGGAVDLVVSQRNEIVETKRMIESFGKLSIPNPAIGSRYQIKVISANPEEGRKVTGIQIFVTTKSSPMVSMPDLPLTPAVKEYTSLRKCDSVTIGWLPTSGSEKAYYCLVVKEGKLREGYEQINQCGLENRMRKSFDFFKKICRDYNHNDQKVLTQRMDRLKPGRNYIIQITVKKNKGPTISYDLLQVQTKTKCDKNLTL